MDKAVVCARASGSLILLEGNFALTLALRAPWREYPPPRLFRLHHGHEAGPVAARAFPFLDRLFRPPRPTATHCRLPPPNPPHPGIPWRRCRGGLSVLWGIDRMLGCQRSSAPTPSGLPAQPVGDVMGHEHQIPRSHIRRPDHRCQDTRGWRPPSRTESRPPSRSRGSRAMVDPDGSLWRTGAAVANDRAMPQRRVRLATGQVPSL
jgi:hypothetical protein